MWKRTHFCLDEKWERERERSGFVLIYIFFWFWVCLVFAVWGSVGVRGQLYLYLYLCWENGELRHGWLMAVLYSVFCSGKAHADMHTHTRTDGVLWTDGKNYIPTRQRKGKTGRFSLIYDKLCSKIVLFLQFNTILGTILLISMFSKLFRKLASWV